MYLSSFRFVTYEKEVDVRWSIKRTCYDTWYPFGILTKHNLRVVDFEPITIFYGGNGSGKTTALNIIAEKLGVERGTFYNRSNFYEDYLKYFDYECIGEIPEESRIITSDDVFDFMLNLRCFNQNIDYRREEMFEEYIEDKSSRFRMRSLDDYEELRRRNLAKTKTQSQYIRKRLSDNVREHSNGESAYLYFTEKIKENALYLLDEPENSLSPKKQLELKDFLTESARFYNCQFIIATHSPFLLSLPGAKIIDFNENPVDVKKWTELDTVREYYEFFKEHEREFE
ncbi:MAG: AAA family ATPase [Eubacterium sp.]|nr:AAA family ATPase [Eubacterium sp.]